MKLKFFLLSFLITFLLCMLVGCGAANQTGVTKKPVALTPTVPVVAIQTNQVSVSTINTSTNDLGVVVRTTNYFTTEVYKTNTYYIPNPVYENGLAVAKTTNSFISEPYQPIIGYGLAAITSLLGWYARKKTVAANNNESMLKAVIAGVEGGGDPDTKQLITAIVAPTGLSDHFNSIVQKVSKLIPDITPTDSKQV